jgi:hypothetical protein
MRRLLLLTCLVGLLTVAAFPQTGVRYDNMILSSTGQPLAGVTITTYSDSACTSRAQDLHQSGAVAAGGRASDRDHQLARQLRLLVLAARPSGSARPMYYTVTSGRRSRFVTDPTCVSSALTLRLLLPRNRRP